MHGCTSLRRKSSHVEPGPTTLSSAICMVVQLKLTNPYRKIIDQAQGHGCDLLPIQQDFSTTFLESCHIHKVTAKINMKQKLVIATLLFRLSYLIIYILT